MSGMILFLEDDPELSLGLQQLVESVGAEAVLAACVQTMINQREKVLQCCMAFLDIDLGSGQPTGLDALDWLRSEKFVGQVYFLTGHGASHPLVAKAMTVGSVEVLSKPVFPETLLQIIEGSRR
jgi:FixJ family two-component response regulator